MNSATFKKIFFLFCLTRLFYGCNSDPFPVGGDTLSGVTQVPFVTTYTFYFKTGTEAISGIEGNLQIISGADVNNLSATANTPAQLPENGVISGIVVDPVGNGVANVSIGGSDSAGRVLLDAEGNVKAGLKDVSGNIVAPLLYNSINGVPEFINVNGTAASGSFTGLNIPPAEYYFKAVRGGRGSTSVSAFANSVSMFKMSIFPVRIPTVALNGQVREADNTTPFAQATVGFPGLGGSLTSNTAGAYSGAGFGSDSRFLVKVSALGHRDSYQFVETNLSQIQAGAITQDIVQNLRGFSIADLASLAAEAGITMDPAKGVLFGLVSELGGSKEDTEIFASNDSGAPMGDIVYFGTNSRPLCCRTSTTTDGGFMVFNLLPGNVFLKAQASVAAVGGVGIIKSSGSLQSSVFSGGVTLANLNLLLINRKADASSTLTLSGNVFDEDGSPVGAASITLLGVSANSATSDGTGAYTIPLAVDANAIKPVLANSQLMIRIQPSVSDTNHITTYQEITTGSEDLNQDLTALSTGLLTLNNGLGAIFGRVRNRRLDGRVDQVKLLPTQVIDSTNGAVTTGATVGTVAYFNPDTGAFDATLTSTTADGRYLITNLPAGHIMLKATSSDDSGNVISRVFSGGVTLNTLIVNHVPVSVAVTGKMSNLSGGDVSDVSLSVLGEQGTFSSNDFINKGIPVPSNGRFVLKATKSGYVSTLNAQLQTSLKPLSGQSLFITTQTELANLSSSAGLSLDLNKGIVFGRAMQSQLEVFTAPKPGAPPALVGAAPQDIAAGLFNADNFPDIAVLETNGATGQVEIFLGKGDGAFFPPQSFAVGADPRAIVTADLNNDGRSDLVVANFADDSLSLLIGQGDGTFIRLLPDLSADVGTEPSFVLAEDLDTDGNVDLLVVNTSAISVLMGEGNGAFSLNGSPCAPTTTTNPCTVTSPIALATGEFDGDGQLDLAVIASASSAITFFLSRAATTTTPLAGDQPSAILTQDVNGDGSLDLIVSNAGSDDISVFAGDGIGGFTKVDCNTDLAGNNTCPVSAGAAPRAMTLNDFDEDGRVDLAVLNEGGNTLALLLGKGDGTFGRVSKIFVLGSGPRNFVVADFNQDNETDFVVVNTLSNNLSLLKSSDRPVQGLVVEARDNTGAGVGFVRYFNDTTGVLDPLRAQTDISGRFMIFDLPLGATVIRSKAKSVGPALSGNVHVRLSEPDTLSTLVLKVDNGAASSLVLKGRTCRQLGIICPAIGNVEFSFLGAKNTEACPPNAECISSLTDGTFESHLDPHSTYTVKLVAPEIKLTSDTDGDGIPDTTDNCPNITNPDQLDTNVNGIGDACELQIIDNDGDGIPDDSDNCPFTPNPDQRDDDGNGTGNVCQAGGP